MDVEAQISVAGFAESERVAERAGVDVTSVEGFGPEKAALVGTLRVAEA